VLNLKLRSCDVCLERWPFSRLFGVPDIPPGGRQQFDNQFVQRSTRGAGSPVAWKAVRGVSMIDLAQLVSESLARHGVETSLDPRRLRWSKWLRCESCFSFAGVPDKGGIFALAQELVGTGDIAGSDGKRMLAVYCISETNHLGLTMGRLFLPGGLEAKRLVNGHCFARYAIVEDAAQRRAAHAIFQQWMTASAETATGINAAFDAPLLSQSSNKEAQIGLGSPLSSGF
jgi:hypothetical protein